MRAAVLATLLVGCATASPSLSSAQVGIEEANQLLIATLLLGDGNRVATVFTDDATILPFQQPGLVKGHQAIAEYWRARLAKTRFLDVQLNTAEVSVSGDLAYEVGTYRLKTQAAEAAPVERTGRYLVVWRQGTDGRWRIQAECPIPDPAA